MGESAVKMVPTVRWFVARGTFALLSALGTAFLFTGCGSECGSGQTCDATHGCYYTVEITSAVPPIEQATWTVKGCLGSSCQSEQVDASISNGATVGGGLLETGLESSPSGGWNLITTLSTEKSMSGKAWSLVVKDTQSNVVTQGSGVVHYAPKSYCPKQEVTIP